MHSWLTTTVMEQFNMCSFTKHAKVQKPFIFVVFEIGKDEYINI